VNFTVENSFAEQFSTITNVDLEGMMTKALAQVRAGAGSMQSAKLRHRTNSQRAKQHQAKVQPTNLSIAVIKKTALSTNSGLRHTILAIEGACGTARLALGEGGRTVVFTMELPAMLLPASSKDRSPLSSLDSLRASKTPESSYLRQL